MRIILRLRMIIRSDYPGYLMVKGMFQLAD